MTTPHDPRRHPLQDDEVELARVLRALPAGEPSAKVDAAILAAATDAVAGAGEAPRPRRRARAAWALPTWAIGTAAAAVLAVGIGIQLLPPRYSAESDRAAAPASAEAIPQAKLEDRTDVDFVERRREIPPTYPPPAPRPQAVAPPPPPPAVASEPMPEAFPVPADDAEAFEAPAAPVRAPVDVTGAREHESRLRQSPAELNRLDMERRTRERQEQLIAERDAAALREEAGGSAAMRDQARVADTDVAADAAADTLADAPAVGAVSSSERALGYGERDDAAAGAFAGNDAAPTAAATAAAPAAAPEMAAAPPPAAAPAPAQPGTLAKAVLPPVTTDATLAPDAWITRIRERVQAGDRDGARASLRLLREKHPRTTIPADLVPLLP